MPKCLFSLFFIFFADQRKRAIRKVLFLLGFQPRSWFVRPPMLGWHSALLRWFVGKVAGYPNASPAPCRVPKTQRRPVERLISAIAAVQHGYCHCTHVAYRSAAGAPQRSADGDLYRTDIYQPGIYALTCICWPGDQGGLRQEREGEHSSGLRLFLPAPSGLRPLTTADLAPAPLIASPVRGSSTWDLAIWRSVLRVIGASY